MLDTDNPDNPDNTDTTIPDGTVLDGAVESPDAGPPPRKRAPRKAAKSAAKKAEAQANPFASLDPASSGIAVTDDSGSIDSEPAAAAPVAATPRKRAPRKAIATQTAPAQSSEASTSVDAAPAADAAPSIDDAVAVDGAGAAQPPAKRPGRRRVAKAPATQIPFDGDAEQSVETPDVATTGTDAPATRTTRRRPARKSAVASDQDVTADDAGPTDDRPAAAAMSTPGVLFMAPQDVEAPPRRRRPAKKSVVEAPDAETPGADDAETPDAETPEAGTPDSETLDGETPDDDSDDSADPDDVREAAIEQANGARRRRRRGRRGRGGGARSDDASDGNAGDDDLNDGAAEDAESSVAGDDAAVDDEDDDSSDSGDEAGSGSSRRRRRRRRSGSSGNSGNDDSSDDPPNTVTHVREKAEKKSGGDDDGVRGIKGSTRLEAKRQRRRDGRETTRRRAPILTEAEFLARREAVDRVMAVRQLGDRTQIAVLEDDILVEHYVTRASATSYVGNVYLGRVQNVLPSMEAAFVDIGKGRNGVLYAGEVNWDAAGLDGKSRTIEHAMKSGDSVLVQVTKDPIGHKGARLTSQVSLPGRFLVYVPGGGMTGISRRLPDTERHRLKAILKKIVPDEAGVIVRTAAEGASEEDLTHDVERLKAQWESIQAAVNGAPGSKSMSAPALLHGEPDLAIRVVRDVFNEDFAKLVVEGDDAWTTVSDYVGTVAPDLAERASRYTGTANLFHDLRVDEQLAKALDRKVWLPSGGSLVIDRTEAMTVVDVNTGRFVGSGGNLEQTVTRNNLEAAEEIVRQLRLRDVGGIVVIDFIDMVLESNRDLVLRRLTECLGRDRTKHQVAEVTSLGLVQMTRKRVGEGLLEAFSEPCEQCNGRGVIIHSEPVDQHHGSSDDDERSGGRKRGRRNGRSSGEPVEVDPPASTEQRQAATAAIAAIHRATAANGDAAQEDSTLATLASDLVHAAMDVVEAAPTEAVTAVEPGVVDSDAKQVVEPVVDEVEMPAQPARRRRRAASRPAGPPVHD